MKKLIAKILIALGIHFIDKKQKRLVYSAMRYSVRNDKQRHSLCRLLTEAAEVCFNGYTSAQMFLYFPEVYFEKPYYIDPKFNGLWWDKYNRVAREQALSNALNKL